MWVEHFRGRGGPLRPLLEGNQAYLHPFVLGELLLGVLPPSPAALRDMQLLPKATVARDDDVIRLITARDLKGRGIGYIDVHLLASALIAGDGILTLDNKLRAAAERIGLPVGP